MDDSQIFLKEDDVLSAPTSALMYQCTFKASEFMTVMQSKLQEQNLFSDGMDCEVLSAGKDWTKGKLRMRLEFCPLAKPAPTGATLTKSIAPDVKELKALPAAPESSDADATNYGEESFKQTDISEQTTVSDSTQISNNFPNSRYPDSNPHSRGMWS